MTEQPPARRLDLAQFASVEDAITKVEQTSGYAALAEEHLVAEDRGLPMLFFGSMINRCENLHLAIAREMRQENPHAVFPLLRAYSECAALLIYVYDDVDYVEALTDRPNKRRHPLGAGKLVAYATKQAAPGFEDAHRELSNFAHLTNHARWQSDEQAMVAAALTLEVSEANQQLLASFADRYLRSGKRGRGLLSRLFTKRA